MRSHWQRRCTLCIPPPTHLKTSGVYGVEEIFLSVDEIAPCWKVVMGMVERRIGRVLETNPVHARGTFWWEAISSLGSTGLVKLAIINMYSGVLEYGALAPELGHRFLWVASIGLLGRLAYDNYSE